MGNILDMTVFGAGGGSPKWAIVCQRIEAAPPYTAVTQYTHVSSRKHNIFCKQSVETLINWLKQIFLVTI